jgi:Holliday junction resolvase-like endonuclease
MSAVTAVIILALVVVVIVLVVIVLRQRDALSRERVSHASEVTRAREDSVEKSRVATLAKASEHVAPMLPDFPYDPMDVQWIGGAVDCVVWVGLTRGGDVEVVFLDVKTGRADLNRRQRRLTQPGSAAPSRTAVSTLNFPPAAGRRARGRGAGGRDPGGRRTGGCACRGAGVRHLCRNTWASR